MTKRLIEFVELGGYPDLSSVYKEMGYEVETLFTARKAVSAIKKRRPDVIVGEFNFQNEFRDRISNLESVLAAVAHLDGVKIIVFYQPSESEIFETFKERFPAILTVAHPIDVARIGELLKY
ncbi:MAG: hypothetical protein GQ470_02860 [Gammaproteobacteria bacterium]|nr:hypothetical protein [Gammaproteobacteria bacterium]